MANSSFLMGSHPEVPATSVTVVAGGNTEVLPFLAGSYYAHDPTVALSAATTLANLIATHADISTCTVALGEDRLFRFTSNAAFTATFNDDTLRTMMGATGNWTTSQTVQTSDVPSEYCWVPGKCATSRARSGTQGTIVYDTSLGMAGPADVIANQTNSHTTNDFQWRYCLNDRVWDVDESSGSYIAFFRRVVRRFWSFTHYRNLINDEGSSAEVVLLSSNRQGPYIMKPRRRVVEEEYSREIENVETYNAVSISVVVPAEYS